MKKLLMNLSVLTMLAISGNSAISAYLQNANINSLKQTSKNDVDAAENIADVLTNLDLGFIETRGY